MATKTNPELLFNNQPIATDAAKQLILAVYGEKRVDEVLDGLADGKYKCASVAGGYLVVVPPETKP